MRKKNTILFSVLGFLTGIFVLPIILDAFGIPGFEVVLTALFGEESLWAIVFSVVLILIVIFVTNKVSNRGNRNNV